MNEYTITDAIIQWLVRVVGSVCYLIIGRPKIKETPKDKNWV